MNKSLIRMVSVLFLAAVSSVYAAVCYYNTTKICVFNNHVVGNTWVEPCGLINVRANGNWNSPDVTTINPGGATGRRVKAPAQACSGPAKFQDCIGQDQFFSNFTSTQGDIWEVVDSGATACSD